jgi:hypothetical protein
MKKIIQEIFTIFREKDLKMYSQKVNCYYRRKHRILLLLLLASCGIQNMKNKDDYSLIPKKFHAKFHDQLDSLDSKYNQLKLTRSFIKDFTNCNTINYLKPIEITIDDSVLYLKYEEMNKKQTVLKFFGHHKGRKFVFYTNYETINFPLVYINKEMTKYTIYLPTKNEILIENRNESETALLFFGGGHSSNYDYRFKILKNE